MLTSWKRIREAMEDDFLKCLDLLGPLDQTNHRGTMKVYSVWWHARHELRHFANTFNL